MNYLCLAMETNEIRLRLNNIEMKLDNLIEIIMGEEEEETEEKVKRVKSKQEDE